MPVHTKIGCRKSRSQRRPAVRLLVEPLEQRAVPSASAWPGLVNPVPEVEPNDTVAVAQFLGDLTLDRSAGVTGAVSAGPTADVDWYTFTLDQAAEVRVLAHAQTPGGYAPVVSLYNTDSFNDPNDLVGHRLLAQSGGPGDPLIDRTVGPGTYFVAVSGAGNRYFSPNLADSGALGASGPYGLLLTATDAGPDPSGPPGVLSADTLAGLTPDATAARSPAEIHLNLSAPLDPSIQGNLSDLNVTLTAANDPTGTNLVGMVTFSSDANDLLVTPAASLAPGTYTISVAGTTFSGVQALNQDFSQTFTVTGVEGQARADDTAATAHDLGDVTNAGLVQQAGAIGDDPAYNPANADPTLSNPAADVDLYHFQVSGVGNYALIGEVFAGRIGSPLDAALTLFRKDPASGQLVFVAVNDNTTNATQDVNGNQPLFYDPVLFSGLSAGDYYLAVSGTTNAPDPSQGISPGQGGVFDPNIAHSGTNGFSTGEYVLNLFVQPASVAPQVVSATPAAGATLTEPPTHLTVQFNIPVNMQKLAYQASQQPGAAMGHMAAVFVRGADGKIYYPRLESYDSDTNTATFVMLDALPNGVNELHLSAAGGLADLSGIPLAGNDPSGDYVVHFTVSAPARAPLDPGPGPTAGMYVWHDQEPNNSAAQPQNLGTLFPSELQKGVVVVRDFTASPASAPSDTADYYQITVVQQARPYLFTLSGTNLPRGAVPVVFDLTTGRTVATVGLAGGSIRLATLDPGDYLISVSGWTTAQAAGVKYTLKFGLGGSLENPTPLTTGPAPAFRIRLPDPPPSNPPPTGSDPGSTPTPPVVTTGSGQTPSTPTTTVQLPPATPVTAPVTTSTSAPQDPATMGPTGSPRLVLPGSTGDTGPGRTVQVSTSTGDAGRAPAVTVGPHVSGDSASSPSVPSGALIQLSTSALGGVRATDVTGLSLIPLRLNLPPTDATAADKAPLTLISAPVIGADESTTPAPIANGSESSPEPSGRGGPGPALWLTWPLGPLVWGWVTSPLVPLTLPPDGGAPAQPDAADETETVAPLAETAAAGEGFEVNSAWAGALMVAGLLPVPRVDREKPSLPGRPAPRRADDAGR